MQKIIFNVTVFLAGILIPLCVAAQSGMEDVIYFKNGEILRGEIIEREANGESLKIETAGRNVFIVWLKEVRTIRKEMVPSPQYFKKAGYVNYTGIAILPGHESTSVRFQMVNGYQFTPRFSAGLGIGFTLYEDPLNLVPLFLDMKYKFLEANITPLIFIRCGYSFSVLTSSSLEVDDHRGGYMLNPGVGLQFETNGGFGWFISAGYNMANSNFEQERAEGRIVENDISYRRLLLGLGLSF